MGAGVAPGSRAARLLVATERMGDKRVRQRRAGAATAVGASQNLQQVTAGVFEVDAAPVVPTVDLVALLFMRIRPIGQIARTYTSEDLVKLDLAHQEGVVLRGDLAVCLHIVER